MATNTPGRGRRPAPRKPGARYAAALGVTVALLALGAGYAFRTLYAAMAEGHRIVRVEGADNFVVQNANAVRPRASAYAGFAGEDAIWRARHAPPVPWWSLQEGPFVWHEPPRQIATDSAYALTRAGRLADAAALLEGWLETHPADTALVLDAARLRNSLGETDAAVHWYRQYLISSGDQRVRAELARVLLDAGRYDDAAREYEELVRRQPGGREYQLGLAESLVWGTHPRDAEPFLRALREAWPHDSAIVALVHSARASYDPKAALAERWVREEPGYRPYRLAYARALLAERNTREAAAQFDTLVVGEATLALLREAASVHGTLGDSSGAAVLWGRAVGLATGNDTVRLAYAQALQWSGDARGAIEQYGILIARQPTAALLLTRGQLYAWRGDNSLGAADLRRSVALEPSYQGFALLGDIARWEGRFGEARSMYQNALALAPGDPRVTAAIADLRHAEALYVASTGAAAEGWTTTGSYTEDNLGFLFLAAGVSTGVALGDATLVGVGVEQRHIAQRYAHARSRYIDGFAVDARARRQLGAHLALSLYAGLARHAAVPDMGFGGAAAEWTRGRISASVSLGQGPVYGSLMSMAALAPSLASGGGVAAPVTGRTATASVSVPLGSASLTVTGERLELSDGNARNLVSAAIRLPLASNVAAIYDGSLMGYTRPSDLYWDPHRYASQAVGVEVTGNPARGLTVALRALPGVAVTEEPVSAPAPGTTASFLPSRRAFQLETGGDVSYHAGRWDASADAGYGRGRDGGYQTLNGSFRVRMQW
jgi:tetratricopeptide (TPR) repeat protein